MGLFKSKEIIVYAPMNGTLKLLEKLDDQVFSKKILGDGIAITPSSNEIYSPLEKGVIINVFHTKHAYGISTGSGPELLLHLGMDTVMLEGVGFDEHVEKGAGVNKSTKLADVDWKKIKSKIPSTDSAVIITNDSIGNYKVELIKNSGKVEAGEPIFKLVKK